jgi:CubicO group peptidase (beta-lactamase class C family)
VDPELELAEGRPLVRSGPSWFLGAGPLDALARDLVHSGVAYAVSLGASVRAGAGWTTEVGSAGSLGASRLDSAVSRDTLFDLASLTKPLTALTAARLARRGKLDFSVPLGGPVHEVRSTPSQEVPFELFLSHRAGLEAHRALFRHLEQGRLLPAGDMLAEAADARRFDAVGSPSDAGFAPVYSDLGYLLAGEAVARTSGNELDIAIEQEVLFPLGCEVGSARRLFARDARFHRRVAPTELVPWRGGVLRGFVHDENAWAYAGVGTAGHAGMFGTVDGLLQLGRALVDGLKGRLGWFLSETELARLVAPRPGGTLRAGFDGKTEQGSSAGTKFGPNTFGHLGFTGTSLWCDPDREWVGVVLTNRVHPTRCNDAIRRARPRAYDALADWAVQTRCSTPPQSRARFE